MSQERASLMPSWTNDSTVVCYTVTIEVHAEIPSNHGKFRRYPSNLESYKKNQNKKVSEVCLSFEISRKIMLVYRKDSSSEAHVDQSETS